MASEKQLGVPGKASQLSAEFVVDSDEDHITTGSEVSTTQISGQVAEKQPNGKAVSKSRRDKLSRADISNDWSLEGMRGRNSAKQDLQEEKPASKVLSDDQASEDRSSRISVSGSPACSSNKPHPVFGYRPGYITSEVGNAAVDPR